RRANTPHADYSAGSELSELVRHSEGLWHSIHPDFLRDQITDSLDRLQMETIDVYLLHNPEYFLKQSSDHPEYYRRIENAFHHLEKEVASGRIRAYGISSNTFPDPKDSQAYTSLEAVHGIAEAIRPDHHFKVIQFPLNLIEAGAALERNNSGKTVLQYAREHGILTLANRPLNAFTGEQLLRLADFPERNQAEVLGRLKDTLTQAMGIERHYPGEEIVPSAKIAWGHILKQNFERLSELDQWRQILANQARPTLRRAFAELEPRYAKWCADYRVASENLFQAFTHFLEWQAGAESRRILDALLRGAPVLATAPATLSQQAIRVYHALGVDCVLVGMRKRAYVEDMLGALRGAPRLSEEGALRALEEIHREVG
ncbi:MAG: aldo/keto reductase, partial [Bdellovibrionota bacterium]